MNGYRFPESPVFYRSLDRTFLEVARGEGVYLYDAQGKRYLDASGGAVVVNIGHGRQEVAEAMARQAREVGYAHGTMFTTRALEEASAALVEMLPRGLDKVYWVTGGSEAAETAFKLARQVQMSKGRVDRYRVVGRWPGYHGNTLGALSASGRSPLRKPYQPMLVDFPLIPAPYCYRCPWNLEYPECGVRCADELEFLLKREGPDSIAAFVAEPIIGSSAGAAVPPPEYFPRIREICDRYQVLLIADEVMTGLGRTGKSFAMEHFGCVPDMLLVGKGVSSGYVPAGCVAVGSSLVQAVRDRFGNFTHGYTFSHHAVVAAACGEVLSILKRESLVDRAEAMGLYLLEKAQELMTFPSVGDIRGRGLMVGIEFVADRRSKTPFPRGRKFIEEVAAKAFGRGLLLYPSTACANGVDGDLVVLAPPFTIEKSEVDQVIALLKATLAEVQP